MRAISSAPRSGSASYTETPPIIGQYTTDPATSGYGIYLVLWFGNGRVQTPPHGNRPRTPEELEQRLEQDLTQDERRKISVVVMDVSKPSRPSGEK